MSKNASKWDGKLEKIVIDYKIKMYSKIGNFRGVCDELTKDILSIIPKFQSIRNKFML